MSSREIDERIVNWRCSISAVVTVKNRPKMDKLTQALLEKWREGRFENETYDDFMVRASKEPSLLLNKQRGGKMPRENIFEGFQF